MNLQFFCPRWGSESIGWDDFFIRIKAEGYDGVEYAIAHTVTRQELDSVWNKAARHGMVLLAQHYDTYAADYEHHYKAYHTWLQQLKDYPVVKINSQTGKDFFSFEQNKALIEAASAFTVDTGIEVVHETHRNKFSFAAHVMERYLKTIPSLRITLDVSHWVCVAESYLQDQETALQLAIARTDHIHARIGYPEGPQVPDPRVPEWQEALQAHLQWWDKVVALKKQEGHRSLTIAPEFGPWPYMVHWPSSNHPIADQYEVNAWMMTMLKERYARQGA